MIEEVALAKLADLVFEKYRKMQEGKQGKIIQVEFAPDRFSRTTLDHTTTKNTEFNHSQPDLIFTNPYKRTCRVKQISLIPNSIFRKSGMAEIRIGDEIFFSSQKFGNFEDVSTTTIPLFGGEILKPDETIKVYCKSKNNEIKLTVQVTLGV